MYLLRSTYIWIRERNFTRLALIFTYRFLCKACKINIITKAAALSILSDKWLLVPCEKASAVGLQAYDLHAEGHITFSHKEHPDVALQSQGSYVPYSVPLALQQEVYVLFHEQLTNKMCSVQKKTCRLASCNQTFHSLVHIVKYPGQELPVGGLTV